MYVPNYVPEPLEVPDNVTEQPYLARLAFVRRVTLIHSGGLLAAATLAFAPWPRIGVGAAVGALAAVLVLLDLWRIHVRGKPIEARVSSAALPLVVALAAWSLRELAAEGFPAWAPFAGPACVLLYTLLCRRDYSFVGAGVLALVASSVLVALLANAARLDAGASTRAIVANAAYLLYFVYDLAALLARRRRGEEVAAVVDLYRDVFNVFGYVPRVIAHWHKHRIWNAR